MALSVEGAAWLVLLKAARKNLILGKQVASVSSGGRSLAIAQIPPEKALAMIDAEIEALEAADKCHDGKVRKRGALRFRY